MADPENGSEVSSSDPTDEMTANEFINAVANAGCLPENKLASLPILKARGMNSRWSHCLNSCRPWTVDGLQVEQSWGGVLNISLISERYRLKLSESVTGAWGPFSRIRLRRVCDVAIKFPSSLLKSQRMLGCFRREAMNDQNPTSQHRPLLRGCTVRQLFCDGVYAGAKSQTSLKKCMEHNRPNWQ